MVWKICGWHKQIASIHIHGNLAETTFQLMFGQIALEEKLLDPLLPSVAPVD